MASELQKGVYKNPDGTSRFWDGENWFDIETEPVNQPASFVAKNRKVIAIALVVIVVTLSGVVFNSKQQAAHQQTLAAAAAAAAIEAKNTADDQERASRQLQVKGIEASVLKMAKSHAADGTITGPILSVSCVPVAGGSMSDITSTTSKFECFAVNRINSDGTSNGFYYNATINWQTGSYTYGYGRA